MGDGVALEDWHGLRQPLATLHHEAACSARGEQAKHRGVEYGERLHLELLEHHLGDPLPRGVGGLAERQGVGYEHGQLLLLDAQDVAEGVLPEALQGFLVVAAHVLDLASSHRPGDGGVRPHGLAERLLAVEALRLLRGRRVHADGVLLLLGLVDRGRGGRDHRRPHGPGNVLARKADLQEAGAVVEDDDILLIHRALELHPLAHSRHPGGDASREGRGGGGRGRGPWAERP
mmetsp:Transcript_32371/g.65419  ORF Transcript_32371/g.65419 Transcript_32371/m.65419 type:complete len:232 (-) Transcript_32371:18-713(-)